MKKKPKGVFLFYGDLYHLKDGVSKKVIEQIECFNRQGLSCSAYLFESKVTRLTSILHRLPYSNVYPTWKYDDQFSQVGFLYFRKPQMTIYFIKVLKEIRRKNPKVKIIMEIPTYPYDGEILHRHRDFPLYIKEVYHRRRLKGLIDRIATWTEVEEIFGIPTLKFSNGIDLRKVSPKKYTEEFETIHMIAVAMFSFWHGFERLIEGLAVYYKGGKNRRNIIVHMVGEGPELPNYKHLISERKLEKHFIFHGFRAGGELDSIYDVCDIAMASFGTYKIGLFLLGALKTREYLAKGIPIVTGCPLDVDRDQNSPYILNFPNDDSPLDVEKIVNFYDEVYENGKDKVIHNIRAFAEEEIGIDQAMKNVIEYINEN